MADGNFTSDILNRLGLGQIESGKGVNLGAGGNIAGLYIDDSMKRVASKFKDTDTPTYRTQRTMIDIKHRLVTEFAVRDMLYRYLARIYDGEFWRIIASDMLDGGFHYKRYQADDRYRLVVNYMFATVNNYVDLLAKNPSIHVPALHEGDDQARALAIQNEKILYGIWENSQMEAQMADNAWYLSLLGSSVVESTPNIDTLIPDLLIQHPGLFYPKTRFGRPNEYLYGIKRFFLDPEQMSDAFGSSWRDSGKYVTVDTASGQWIETDHFTKNIAKVEGWFYYSPWERALFIQDRILDDYSVQFEEPKEIPWRIISFYKRPGKTYGIGAVEQTWGLNQYINQLMSQQANIIAYAANPLLAVKDGQHTDEKIPNDPGAVINVGPQGGVDWIAPPHPSLDLSNALAGSKKAVEDISGMPEVRYGNIKQSFATGRAIEQLNAPVADRIAQRENQMSAEFQHINRIALKQFEEIAKNRTVELYGDTEELGAFTLSVKGSMVQGYYRNKVDWDDHDHSDTVEVLQLVGAGMLDRKTGITALGYREPDQILERVRKDRLEDIAISRVYEQGKVATLPSAELEALAPGDMTRQLLESASAMTQQTGLENGGVPGGPGGMPPTGGAPGGTPGGPAPPAAGAPPASPTGPPGGPLGQMTAMGSSMPSPPAGPTITRKGFGQSPNLHLAAGGIYHLGTVISDFHAVPPLKIKGSVFLFGHITDGAASKIQVFLTAGVDKATLINALPDYKGSLIFAVGKTPPPGAIDVTPDKGNVPPQIPGVSPSGGPPTGPGGGVPPLPDDNQRYGPGSHINPQGLRGPLMLKGQVTPEYQQIPLPPPGMGPISGTPTGR